MKTKYVTIIMSVICVLLFVGIFGVTYLGIQNLDKESNKLTDLKAKKDALSSQQVSLVQAKKDIEKYTELNNIAKSVVPQDKEVAKTVREISQFAAESGIPLEQIKFETSTLGDKKPVPVAKPEDNNNDAPAQQPPKDVVPSLTQVSSAAGLTGVFIFPIEVISPTAAPVPFENLINFLNKLENNRRTAQIELINIAPNSENPDLISFRLKLNAYVRPEK